MGFKPLLNIFWNRLGMSVPLGPACRTPPAGDLLKRHALDVVRITMLFFCSLSYQVVNMWGYPVLYFTLQMRMVGLVYFPTCLFSLQFLTGFQSMFLNFPLP